MSDIYEIQKLKARYFRCMDTKQWAEMRTCFTDGFRFFRNDSTEPASVGGDAFMANLERHLEHAVTIHHGHMPEIDITGDRTATGIWAMFDFVDDPVTGRAINGYGHYHEQYEKGDDGRWRIAQMRLTRIRVDRRAPTHAAVIDEGRRLWGRLPSQVPTGSL